MKKNNGFTLVELTVALGIVAIVAYGFMTFMSRTAKEVKKIQTTASQAQDASVVEKYLAQNLPSGNIRFFSYNSAGNRVRSIYPMPERCANLSKGDECKNDTGVLYVKHNSNMPSISLLCRLSASENVNPAYLIDLNVTDYGTATKVAKGMNVSSSVYPSGLVDLQVDKVLTIFTPPFAYLFRVSSAAIAYAPVQDNGAETFSANPELNSDCMNLLKVQSVAAGVRKFDVSKLFKVRLEPLFISQLSGTAGAPDPATINFSHNDFPLRAFNATLESFGRSGTGATASLGINRCEVRSGVLHCDQETNLRIKGPSLLRIDQKFKVGMLDESGNVRSKNNWYEVISESQSPTCATIDGLCDINHLKLDSIDNIPYLSLTEETKNKLFSSSFSMLKQDELEALRFRIRTTVEKTGKSFHVFIP